MTTSDTVLGRFVQRIASQYPLGLRAAEVGRAIQPESTRGETSATIDYSAVARVLEQHPELQLAVTRVVQHPRFGGIKLRQMMDADLAADLAAMEPDLLAGLLYGFTLPEGLSTAIEADELGRYWLRTLWRGVGTRIAARSLATASPAVFGPLGIPGSDLFSAAMLLDIGQLVLFAELKQTYARFVTEARELGHDLCQLELDSLGFDHRILTTRVLSLWPIHPNLIRRVNEFADVAADVAAAAEGTSLAGAPLHSHVLVAAEYLAELIDGGREELARPLVAIAAEFFEWDAADLERWIGQIAEPVRHLANCFGVDLSEPAEISASLENAWQARYDRAVRAEANTSGGGLGQPDSTMGGASDLSDQASGAAPLSWENCLSPTDSLGSRGGATTAVAANARPSAMAAAGRPAPIRWEESAPREAWSDWLEDPVLRGQISAAVESSRACRQPLSIILVQIDQYESLMFGATLEELDQLQQALVDGIGRISRLEGGRVVELGDDRLGVLLPGLDRTAANRCGQEILRVVRQWSGTRLQKGKTGLSLSLGCAATDVPARNLQAETLIEAAARCLESVRRASGNGLKSIDIYY